MPPKYQVRVDDLGRTGLYINGILVIFNMDSKDKSNFHKEFGEISLEFSKAPSAEDNLTRTSDITTKQEAKRGRKLMLAPYESVIRDFIHQDSSITATEVQNKLRRMGIRFSGISAVTNLARSLGLNLAA